MLRTRLLDDDDRMRTVAQPVQDVLEVGGAGRQDDPVGDEARLVDGDGDVGEPLSLGVMTKVKLRVKLGRPR